MHLPAGSTPGGVGSLELARPETIWKPAGLGETAALRGVMGVEDPVGVVVVVDQDDSRHAPSPGVGMRVAISSTACRSGTTSTGAIPRDSSTPRIER